MKKLRWIHFNEYPASSFPSNFLPKELGCLELPFSQQKELWHGYKHLPNLKILDLSESSKLIMTPDFEGLSCLERLILEGCESLEEIHSSIGDHKRLVFVNLTWCTALKRFPSIVHMKKLETLNLGSCKQIQQFPDIQSNMDSLVTLDLSGTGIEIIPPSVGRFCTNLVSLDLGGCSKLNRIEGNFHLLRNLKDLDLYGCKGLQSFHEDRSVSLKLPQFPRFLRELNLSGCNLGDEDIPSDIFCKLLNLQRLDLSYNDFSILPSGLSQIPCLKLLNLSHCVNLVELPELPSSITIIHTYRCGSR
ncbi:putative leucine-rich repeat domain superfamily [Helianthus annuus]|nr:putative leucine-rich repeat domain superfamily [Helianthus annuus]